MFCKPVNLSARKKWFSMLWYRWGFNRLSKTARLIGFKSLLSSVISSEYSFYLIQPIRTDMLFSRPNTCMNKAMNWVRDISRAFHWLTLASFHYFDIGFTTVVRKIFLYQTKTVKGLSDLLKRSLKNLSLILRCLILPIQKEKKNTPGLSKGNKFFVYNLFFSIKFYKKSFESRPLAQNNGSRFTF